MRAGDADIVVGIRCSNLSAWLVAGGAQVALTAIKHKLAKSVEIHRGGGLQGPVRNGVAGVNLVAGAAVLAGYVYYIRKLVRFLSRSNHGAERCTGVASCAGSSTAGISSSRTGRMEGFFPGKLFPGDYCRVLVAGHAVSYLYLSEHTRSAHQQDDKGEH
ncbi:MAG: hypothetical protein ABIL62_18430 [Planctomycetota bacterium]